MKLHTVENEPGMLVFQCPACGNCHFALVGDHKHPGPTWGWNGSMDKPTFTPSIIVRGVVPPTDEQVDRIMAGEKIEPVKWCCHFMVEDGKIRYLGDCSHEMKNQTVDIPEW